MLAIKLYRGSNPQKDEVTSLANYREVAGKKSLSSKTKKGLSINLGKLHHSEVAKTVDGYCPIRYAPWISIVSSLKHIDWSSSKAITKAFKALLKTIEKEFSVEEIA